MIGQTISHYRILEKLGEGGMGVVYKGEDTKLKRLVALKFLPPDLTRDPEAKQRFVQEAQAASALQHNNICTIHEIDKTREGQIFICMDYYEGETMKRKIERGPLAIEEAIGIAIQTVQGLSKAHSQNIIHRDIKPANIMITHDGVVKILDFGLAKLAGQSRLTKASTTMGTVAYMSPEQTHGEEVDRRTDIWSLGVVLYEMLTGKLPFKGDYEQAVVYSILNEEPQPLTTSRSGLSNELENIVSTCLKKDPLDRYQQAEEVIRDLQSLREKETESRKEVSRTARRSTSKFAPVLLLVIVLAALAGYFVMSDKKQNVPELHALAVLPFSNIRSDPETDFLSYALANQIIGDLAYLKSISVRPSSSIRPYENRVVDVREAGSELKVEYVLAGNYQVQGDRVRLDVELVNVNTNELIWREPIEVKYENAFKLQDMVSEKVIRGLKVQFSAEERQRMQVDVPRNATAYEFYLRGIAQPSTIDGIHRAIELLQRSIEIDSTFAPAFNELGFRIHRLAVFKLWSIDRIWEAEQAYQKAVSLNPDLLSALGNLSTLYTETGKLENAEKLAKRMLAINPNSAMAHFALGYAYRYSGFMKEAAKEMELAVTLDPRDLRFRSLGVTYCYLGEYDKVPKALEIDKGSQYAFTFRGWALLRQGRSGLAVTYFDRAIAMEPEAQLGLWSSALKASVQGNNDEGLRALRRSEQGRPPDADHWLFIAETYALLGDKADCLRALRKAVEGGFFNYPFLLRDSFLDSVRDDPEFQRVLALAKEKHEYFKKKFFPDKGS
ncbi:MAG: protein kinase [bacterium]